MTEKQFPVIFFMQALHGGGAEKVMARLANELSNMGFGVTFVTAENSGPNYRLLNKNILKINFQSTRFDRLIFKSGSPNVVQRLLIRLQNFLLLCRYLRKVPADAVLISALNDANLLAGFATVISRTNARLIATQHSNLSASMSGKGVHKRFWRIFLPWALRRASKVVSVSHGVAQNLESQFGIKAERLLVIPNPVCDEQLESLADEKLESDFFSDAMCAPFVVVGRLVKLKRVQDTITSCSESRKMGYDSRLAILGKGPERTKLEESVKSLGLEEYIQFFDYQENPYKYLANSRALILASEYEGMPTVLIEAMCLGLPVISSNCDYGPSEILEGGNYGHLFEVGDIEHLTSLMIESMEGRLMKKKNPDIVRYSAKYSANSWAKLITSEPASG